MKTVGSLKLSFYPSNNISACRSLHANVIHETFSTERCSNSLNLATCISRVLQQSYIYRKQNIKGAKMNQSHFDFRGINSVIVKRICVSLLSSYVSRPPQLKATIHAKSFAHKSCSLIYINQWTHLQLQNSKKRTEVLNFAVCLSETQKMYNIRKRSLHIHFVKRNLVFCLRGTVVNFNLSFDFPSIFLRTALFSLNQRTQHKISEKPNTITVKTSNRAGGEWRVFVTRWL